MNKNKEQRNGNFIFRIGGVFMKEYYEFNSEPELNKHLKYWSNACGELHHY